jgi:hypothetical protein
MLFHAFTSFASSANTLVLYHIGSDPIDLENTLIFDDAGTTRSGCATDRELPSRCMPSGLQWLPSMYARTWSRLCLVTLPQNQSAAARGISSRLALSLTRRSPLMHACSVYPGPTISRSWADTTHPFWPCFRLFPHRLLAWCDS